jgi:hypothetical protein
MNKKIILSIPALTLAASTAVAGVVIDTDKAGLHLKADDFTFNLGGRIFLDGAYLFNEDGSARTEVRAARLEAEGIDYQLERKRVRKHGEERIFTHFHIRDRFPVELTMYAPDKATYQFKSSITGKAIERATLPEFEQFLQKEYPDFDLESEVTAADNAIDRFQVYRSLLIPLSGAAQGRE